MAPRGRPKKGKVVEANAAVTEEVVKNKKIGKVEKSSKKVAIKKILSSGDENNLNGSGIDLVSGSSDVELNAPANDEVVLKRSEKPAKTKSNEEGEKGEESSLVKPPPTKRGKKAAEIEDGVDLDKESVDAKKLPAKRGRKAAKIENEVDLDKDSEENDEAKKLPSKRGRKAAKIENGVDLDKDIEENVDAKNLPAKRGRKAAKIENTVALKDKEDKDEAKDLPSKRGRKAAKIENSIDSAKEDNGAKDGPRSKRNAKAEVAPSNSVKEQKLEKKAKSKNDTYVLESAEENSSEKEIPAKGAGQTRKNALEKPGSKKDQNKKSSEVDEDRKLVVAIQRNQKLDEMAWQQREQDVEHFEEPKVKNVKGPTKGKGKRAAKDPEEDPQPTKKTKDDKSKGAAKKEKDKIPDVTALDFSNESKTSDGKPWNFKIATWNVNGLRAWLEKNGVSYLHHEMPDILCIQETKCSNEKLPPELVNVEGYQCYWLAGDKDGYSGVGLLSKEKPKSVHYGIDMDEHDSEGRVITAEYEDFYVVTTYIPNAGRGLVRLDYRQKWDKDFRAYVKKLDEKKPVILCGDLNVAHEEIDLANPKGNKKNAGFTKEEREGFSTLLSEGFIDTFRQLYPEKDKAYTFWTYMMNARAKNVGWRLDYFVISKRFADHLCDSVIRKDVYGSDHCPITLFLHV